MAPKITIRRAPGTWSVRSEDGVLAETKAALELTEGDHPPVIYIPRSDIAMAFLDASDTSTACPWKGQASYFSLVGKAETIADVAWSYDTPIEAVGAIKDHLAFYPSKVVVEQL